MDKCRKCGKKFVRMNNRQIYCDECKLEIYGTCEICNEAVFETLDDVRFYRGKAVCKQCEEKIIATE